MSVRAEWRQALAVAREVLRQRLDLLIPVEHINARLPRWALLALQKLLPKPELPRGERLRDAFVNLGPVYIKLGQLLSTRPDLLPADVVAALDSLQDRVPAIPDFDVHAFVSSELGQTAEDAFASIEREPLAAASIAQVHTAVLADGREVVVKLVRPGIKERIEADMTLIRRLVGFVDRSVPDARRLHLPRVMRDHEDVLVRETSMRSEARNQTQLRRNFADSDLLYVPLVHDRLSTDRLLVMERVYGTPVNRVDELEAQGTDLTVLAHKGVETFFIQVFRHNFFHADMHPGNILVDTTNPKNPRYIALDCAIIGSLTEQDQTYLAQNLLAFFHRDYQRVVALHLESGWVPADTDPEAFEAVIREVCEPIFARPLAEISFGDFVVELFQAAAQFNMEIQPQLVLLQKTLLYIEGVGRQLYPQLDLWETAAPFMEAWAEERFGPAALVNDWLRAGPGLWQQFARLPTILRDGQADLRQLKRQMVEQRAGVTRLEAALQRQNRSRRYRRTAGVGLVAASILLLWQPLASGLASGDLAMLGGVVSAFLGSALLVRA